MPLEGLYKQLPDDGTREFTEWDHIVKAFSDNVLKPKPHKRWIFRGHERNYYRFETSLERAIWSHSELQDGLEPAPQGEEEQRNWLAKKSQLQRECLQRGLKRHFDKRSSQDKDYIPVLEIEGGLIRRFQRQAHHYLQDTPAEHNYMEWLALMRHFGAPTRLMDWTWSFYVALFFAIHRTEAETCAVWALNYDELRRAEHLKAVSEHIHKDPNIVRFRTFETVFKKRHRLVANVSAFRLNERLLVQQGTFLAPGDVAIPFEDNLSESLKTVKYPDALVKFNIRAKRDTKQEILLRLHEMNIGRATLFPGLDGFAQTLDQLLTIPDVLRASNKWNPENVKD